MSEAGGAATETCTPKSEYSIVVAMAPVFASMLVVILRACRRRRSRRRPGPGRRSHGGSAAHAPRKESGRLVEGLLRGRASRGSASSRHRARSRSRSSDVAAPHAEVEGPARVRVAEPLRRHPRVTQRAEVQLDPALARSSTRRPGLRRRRAHRGPCTSRRRPCGPRSWPLFAPGTDVAQVVGERRTRRPEVHRAVERRRLRLAPVATGLAADPRRLRPRPGRRSRRSARRPRRPFGADAVPEPPPHALSATTTAATTTSTERRMRDPLLVAKPHPSATGHPTPNRGRRAGRP